MPKIDREHIGVAFDMHGCPNRCRHCWLGPGSNRKLAEQDVRWGVSRFRDFMAEANTHIKKLSVATWFREPDFSDDYRDLYELEAELSDGKPARYELLSIWRLARDESYVDWAKSVGPDSCQISFFGLDETNDWFHRRKGAFRDALTATERLLCAGMKPRWQIFLTTKLLPDLSGLLDLVGQHRLRERIQELAGEFQMFMHPPGPDYEGRQIENLRPTADQLRNLPDAILKPSKKHFGKETLWETEAALRAAIREGAAAQGGVPLPGVLWFFVCSNWDVFANIGTLEPWWRLGNLKKDAVETILHRLTNDETLGLQSLRQPSIELAETYGDAKGQKVYSSAGDLLSLYRGRYCEEEWNRR